MYVGIDVGGTKTLVAKLSDDGQIIDSRRFPSSHDYSQFLHDLDDSLQALQLEASFRCCIGLPGLINRQTGIAHSFGNLPWRDVPIRDDISRLVGGQTVIIENDARLAGLSEARLIKDKYDNILFLTVSTGIGGALIQDGKIVRALEDTEVGKMPLLHDGDYVHWEEFAGGRAVVTHFHKPASEITDPAQWREIGENLAHGLGALCSVLQPEVIVLGGGVGQYADHYSPVILEFLAKHLHANVRQPQAILAAQRPDKAVIYGCYDLAKQVYGDEPSHG
jgi:glucokinase